MDAGTRPDLARLQGIVEETGQHIRDGNLDGAQLVLGTQGGKVGRFTDAWGELQKALKEAGADWERARDAE